jgi:hypothetical protein
VTDTEQAPPPAVEQVRFVPLPTGVRGEPCSRMMHPLVRWLAGELPGAHAQLGAGEVLVWGRVGDRPWESARVPLPRPVADLVDQVDAGRHPDLTFVLAPPSVAVPHVDFDPPIIGAPTPHPHPLMPSGEAPAADLPVAGDGPPGARAPGGPADHTTAWASAHVPYGDAVACALQLRGIPVKDWWTEPVDGYVADRPPVRGIGIILGPDAAGPQWDDYLHLLVRWDEERGWHFAPYTRPDSAAPDWRLFWDVRADEPVPDGWPLVPVPEAVARWVSGVLAATPGMPAKTWVAEADEIAEAHQAACEAGDIHAIRDTGRALVSMAAEAEQRTLGRRWWAPAGVRRRGARGGRRAEDHHPAFDAWLAAYHGHIGHHLAAEDRAREATADTGYIPVVADPTVPGTTP